MLAECLHDGGRRGGGDDARHFVRHFWVGDMTRSWGEQLCHTGEMKRGG